MFIYFWSVNQPTVRGLQSVASLAYLGFSLLLLLVNFVGGGISIRSVDPGQVWCSHTGCNSNAMGWCIRVLQRNRTRGRSVSPSVYLPIGSIRGAAKSQGLQSFPWRPRRADHVLLVQRPGGSRLRKS